MLTRAQKIYTKSIHNQQIKNNKDFTKNKINNFVQ